MTDKTRLELVYEALANLSILAAGQTPAAEDVTVVDALVEPVLADLERRDIVFVATPDLIRPEYFLPLGQILAWAAAPKYNAASDPVLKGLADLAEEKLKTITRTHGAQATLRCDTALLPTAPFTRWSTLT